ncbi:hypothetical protein Vadar_006998 [Vaccinium darrowii]|uniref:Uncharacterized protein n=1 Tax=Vaccinium darrowii TaxID=229202 RepID=A0ACB7YCA4_9ERIC|nr:hypothetical protein Vadar_006998 [Vaccinium darrowii]
MISQFQSRFVSFAPIPPPVILFARSGSSMDLIEQELDRLRSPDPGPRDLSVVTLQDRHRSKCIWDLDMEPPNDSAKVSFRRVETELRKNAAPCEEIMVYVRKANLEGLLRVPFVALDRGLITALVERWSPETHSFHLRPGEMTVTLQDVEVILGLPVEGEAVTRSTNLKDIDQLCTRLLGKAPSKNNNELQG